MFVREKKKSVVLCVEERSKLVAARCVWDNVQR